MRRPDLALVPGDCQSYDTAQWSAVTGTTTAPPERTRRFDGFRSLPGVLRWGTYLIGLLVVLLIAALITVVVLVRKPLPQTDGTIEVPGLSGKVEVIRDDHGIPQIYADTTEDLMRAQGYVHAQERFFEMDVRRHATAGRLAEMFGDAGLETDKMVRTMGWRQVAEQELPLLEPATRSALQAYADGVNAYLDDNSPSSIALEYTVLNLGGLNYHPADWTAVDSLAWLKAMAWDLRGNMDDEIDRVMSIDAVGEQRAAQLFPEYPYNRHRTIVDQGTVVDGVFQQDAIDGGTRLPTRPAWTADRDALDALARTSERSRRMPALLGRGDGIGSNSWVVSGEHTTTGEPLLANDPHLGVSMPGVWMQMGLHCREVGDACPYDVSGFTFSGFPGVIIGHNADIAWGFTNLGPDVTDLFVERVEGDTWRYAGKWRPLRTREETIKVAGGDDVKLTVRSTAHGPIVSDVDDATDEVAQRADGTVVQPPSRREDGERYAVSLAWTALTPRPTADAVFALNQARDFTQFRAAASRFAVPSQNLVYADREGHIGYQAPGVIPIRKSGNDGRLPSAGWRPENDWTGQRLPFDSLPNVLDPEEGFVVTANQAVVRHDYPGFLTDDWDYGYRSEQIRSRIEEELAKDPGDDPRLSVADMAQIQLDDYNPIAALLTPYLLDADLSKGYYSQGQELLRDWDFTQPTDSAAAAYFNVVYRRLLENTFGDELPADQWPDGGSRWFAVLERLIHERDDPWWDDVETEDVVETRDDMIVAAMRQARDELTSRQSPKPEEWEWGRLHELDLRSSTLGESGIGPVEALFNRGGFEPGGGGSLVNATSWDAREGYQVTAAPSMRMVVSLADFDRSRWINLTGVSGHPASSHYTDQTDLWVEGETLPWAFSRDQVEDAADQTLSLEPTED